MERVIVMKVFQNKKTGEKIKLEKGHDLIDEYTREFFMQEDFDAFCISKKLSYYDVFEMSDKNKAKLMGEFHSLAYNKALAKFNEEYEEISLW